MKDQHDAGILQGGLYVVLAADVQMIFFKEKDPEGFVFVGHLVGIVLHQEFAGDIVQISVLKLLHKHGSFIGKINLLKMCVQEGAGNAGQAAQRF